MMRGALSKSLFLSAKESGYPQKYAYPKKLKTLPKVHIINHEPDVDFAGVVFDIVLTESPHQIPKKAMSS